MDGTSASDAALQTLRGDVINIVLGTVFLAVGATVVAIAAIRWQRAVRILVWWGIFSGIFGLQKLGQTPTILAVLPHSLNSGVPYVNTAVMYLLLVSALFAWRELTLGKLRLLIQLEISVGLAIAVVGIGTFVLGGQADKCITPKIPYTSQTSIQIVTDLIIASTAPLGAQDVIVTNSDGQKGTLPGGFTVVSGLPSVSLSARAVAFAIQLVSTTGPMKSVTLTNTGTGTLSVSTITASTGFVLTTSASSCPYAGGLVGPGASCTIDIAFNPNSVGQETGKITITDNAPDSPQSLSLTGSVLSLRRPDLILSWPVPTTWFRPKKAKISENQSGVGF